MAELVYILCILTSLACAVLLLKAFFKNRISLLFWSSICFFFLSISNVMLICDLIIYPNVNLTVWRVLPALLGVSILISRFVWDIL